MLNIINPEFFSFRLTRSMTERPEYLIHAYANMERLDMPVYRMTPYASFIIKSSMNCDLVEKLKMRSNSEYVDVNDHQTLENLMIILTSSHYRKISTFKDDGTFAFYEKEAFPSEMFHTLLFVELEADERSAFPELNLALIAQPIRGVILPIKRTPCHRLYAGSLIVPPKIFPHLENVSGQTEKVYYTKIVYLFVDIISHFMFSEVRKIDNDIRAEEINRFFVANSPIPYLLRSEFDCENYPERDGLMKLPPQPLFNLSDIPKGISYGSDSVRTVLPSS